MHATVHTAQPPGDALPDPRAVARAVLPAGSEPAGCLVLEHPDEARCTVVALWSGEPAARSDDGRVYRVSDEMLGRAAGRRPLFAQLTWMNPAGDPAAAAAAERGGRDRVWPAVRDLDGIVAVYALRSTDDRIVVVGLVTGREVHDAVRDVVMATELLPGEDPALLPGPDRIEEARVLLAELPAGVRS